MFPTEHDKEYKRWTVDGGDEKFRYDYNLNSESLVMDLGGYKGQFASDIFARYNCRVLVFEPVKLFAEKIKDRFKSNGKIEVFCLAVGEKRRTEVINLCGDGSSMYATGSAKETIQFEDVAEFFAQHHIKSVDLLKVNIEGGEYELLSRLIQLGIISKIKNIQVQFHNISTDSQVRMEMICNALRKTHCPTYQYKFVWENWALNDKSN